MKDPTIVAVDRLAKNIVGSLHKIFGFAYSFNMEHYTYQKTMDTPVNYTATTILNDSLRITQDADFICTRVNVGCRRLVDNDASIAGMRYVQTIDNVQVSAHGHEDTPCTITLRSGGSDREMQNEAIDAWLCYGHNGGLPGLWSKPRLFGRNTNVGITLNVLRAAGNAADSIRFRIAFMGWKIYDAKALNLTGRRS